MKRIRRNLSPILLAGFGVWMLVSKTASPTILGIGVIVLSALGIVLNVTDRESSKPRRGFRVGLDCVILAGGAWLVISPESLQGYLKYILGGIVTAYSLMNLLRMFRNKYRKGSRIAECVPAALGIALMFIPLGEDLFIPCCGGVMAATGVITFLGNWFGKKKKDAASRQADPDQKQAPSSPAEPKNERKD